MNPTLRWTVLILVIFAVVLIPFLSMGEAIDTWTEGFLNTVDRSWVTAGVLAGLLTADIVLPIPSSLVSTSAGFLLGWVGGTLTAFAGMTAGAMIGYALGRWARPGAQGIVGPEQLARLEAFDRRWGGWTLAATRAVPMLAEAAILAAGMGRMNFVRFLVVVGLSNLAVSAVYAAVGAFSASIDSFLWAFLGSIAVPAIGMFWWSRPNKP